MTSDACCARHGAASGLIVIGGVVARQALLQENGASSSKIGLAGASRLQDCRRLWDVVLDDD